MAEARAVTKYVRVKPLKARQVMNLIRGKKAEHALGVLQFCDRKAAREIEKTLRSAIANAENNQSLNLSSLVISEAKIDGGPTMKPLRWRTAPRFGRLPIRKRTSMITIAVREEQQESPAEKTTA